MKCQKKEQDLYKSKREVPVLNPRMCDRSLASSSAMRRSLAKIRHLRVKSVEHELSPGDLFDHTVALKKHYYVEVMVLLTRVR